MFTCSFQFLSEKIKLTHRFIKQNPFWKCLSLLCFTWSVCNKKLLELDIKKLSLPNCYLVIIWLIHNSRLICPRSRCPKYFFVYHNWISQTFEYLFNDKNLRKCIDLKSLPSSQYSVESFVTECRERSKSIRFLRHG